MSIMMIAEIHGKLGSLKTSMERYEDILVSNFFGIARYLGCENFLIPFLNTAMNKKGQKLTLQDITKGQIKFWPKIAFNREADLIIELVDVQDDTTLFIVECKLDSGKSNSEVDDSSEISGDQLADQYMSLQDYKMIEKLGYGNIKKKYNLYITANINYPFQDIEESFDKLKQKGQQEDYFVEGLYWTNWQAGYEILKDALNNENLNATERMSEVDSNRKRIERRTKVYKTTLF